MALNQAKARRWAGSAALLISAAMLVLGETLLKGKLTNVGFLLYWLSCIVLTSIAIILALVDLRMQRQNARAAHRELLETALKEIESEARARQSSGPAKTPAAKSRSQPHSSN